MWRSLRADGRGSCTHLHIFTGRPSYGDRGTTPYTLQRTFLLNLALVLVLNLLVKPFYILGIDAGVQVRVGSEAYGAYAALLSLSFLLNIVLDLGITNWNTRHIARHQHLLRKHMSGILAVRALLVLAYAVITLGAGLLLGYGLEEMGLLAVLVLNQSLASLLLYLRSNIAGAQRFAQDSLLSVLDRALLIVMVGLLLWGRASDSAFEIRWFAWAQTAAYGAAVLVAGIFTWRLGAGAAVKWNTPFSVMILRQSFPFALLILLMTFYYRTDMVMIERLLPDGPRQAGIYAQGFRFFEAFNMIGFLVAGLLLPMYSRMIQQRQAVGPLTGLATRLMIAGALTVAVIGSLHARTIMDLRYHEATDLSAPAFAVLIQGSVAVSLTYVFGTLLTAGGDLRALNIVAACGMAFNIGLNLWAIPRYQVMGAAWSGLITQWLTAVAQIAIASRQFKLRTWRDDGLRILLFAIGLVLLAWGVGRWIPNERAALGLSVALAVAWAFASGMIRWSALRALLPEKG